MCDADLEAPTPAEGWAWAGLEPWSGEDAIGHVVHGVRQLIKGEPIRPARPLPPLAVVGLVIGGLLLLILLLTIAGAIISLV